MTNYEDDYSSKTKNQEMVDQTWHVCSFNPYGTFRDISGHLKYEV